MIIATLLVKGSPTKECEVYEVLKNLDEVADCHVLFGEYDIIAKLEVSDFYYLVETVAEKIALIPGIVDTKVIFSPLWLKRRYIKS